jgi:acylphosphatase
MTQGRARILVEGLVQGVGFRAWVAREAMRRGLGGWVRNRRTGAVEAMFLGAEPVVAEMVEVCRRGPPAARVDALYSIDEFDIASDAFCGDVKFRDFEVRDTV